MDPLYLAGQGTVVLGLYDQFIRAINCMVIVFQPSTGEMKTDLQIPGSVPLLLSLAH